MINLVALPCLCVDVFDGTDELRAGGEALNFAVHASKFEEFNVSILGAVGQDSYAKFIMDSVSDKRIDVSHVRVEEDKVTANNRTYLTADGDRYYKDDSWTGYLRELVTNDGPEFSYTVVFWEKNRSLRKYKIGVCIWGLPICKPVED